MNSASGPVPTSSAPLPAWPITLTFLGYPLWWLLGPGELIWWGTSLVMAVLLSRRARTLFPRGVGIWVLFLLWTCASLLMLDSGGRVIGWGFRFLFLLTPLVVLVYAFNAPEKVTERAVGMYASITLAIMTVGAYLGVLFPVFRLKTPMAYVLPQGIASNELVSEIVLRRLTQYDGSYGQGAPRPSAPFLYTNDWGLVYSIVFPLVFALAVEQRRQRRVWWLVALLSASLPAAFFTQNRGMILALVLVAVYLGFRGVLAANYRLTLGIVGSAVVVGAASFLSPFWERIQARQSQNDTGDIRASLYAETFNRTLGSPLVGFGGPRPSNIQGAPSAGTQGQLWEVLFAFGFVGAALFFAFLLLLFFKTTKAMTPMGLAINACLGVSIVQCVFYDLDGTGLYLLAISSGVVMRRLWDQRQRQYADASESSASAVTITR